MTTRRTLASPAAVAAGFVASVLYVVVDGTGAAGSWLYDGLAALAPLAVIIGMLLYRPPGRRVWVLLAIGLALDLTGELLWDLAWDAAGSIPDIAYSAGYVFSALGVVMLARIVTTWRRDADDLLDLFIVATSVALLTMEFLVEPAIDASGAAMERITAVMYPVIGVAVLFTLCRAVGDRERRVPALWLLFAAFAVRLVADLVYSWQLLYGTYTEGAVLDTFWMMNSALFVAAALHPTMARLTAPRTEGIAAAEGDHRRGARARLMTFGGAAVTIPMVVGIHNTFIAKPHVWAPVGIACLEVLVVWRVVRLLGWRVRAEAALEHQALHDPLTGLPNRALFLDRVEHARAGARRTDATFALLFLDLDRFKVLNDSLGHRAGDILLVEVAQRLSRAARAGDTVARFGGDEFAVLSQVEPGRDPVAAAVALADRLAHALRDPIVIDDDAVIVTVSIGVAIGDATSTSGALLRDADAAMYRAKEAGRDRVEVFDELMRARAVARLTLEQDLRAAVARGEFVVHYQPVVTLSQRSVAGYEALVRWQHPTRGLLPPSEFLDAAEETGLIGPMGEIVLTSVLRDLAEVGGHPELVGKRVAVNVSMRQLSDDRFVDFVAAALDRYKITPSRLCLEITEHALARDPDRVADVLAALSAQGVRIAVDDFGTGYSSLLYLRRFPVDILKIDRSFVAGLGIDADDTAIVHAVIDLGHALGLTVLAEGVEDMVRADLLTSAGCDLAQGLVFGAPAPLAEPADVPA